MRVLLASADEPGRTIVAALLATQSCMVTETGDGREAWRHLQDLDGYDLLIADFALPSLNGVELCQRVRSQMADENYVYVLITHPTGEEAIRHAAIGAGADDFLLSPIERGELATRLTIARRLLSMQRNVRARPFRSEWGQNPLLEGESPLGQILIAYDVITPEVLQMAIKQQERTRMRLGQTLVANGWASEDDVAHAQSVQLDMPFVRVGEETPDTALLHRLPKEEALRHRLLPLNIALSAVRGVEVVRVAIVDPWNVDGLDVAQRILDKPVEPLMASETALMEAIERAYQTIEARRRDTLLSETLAQTGAYTGDAFVEEVSLGDEGDDFAPVIRTLNTIFVDAIRRRASDIHIEPYKRDFEIRYRVDGELHVIQTLPRQMLSALTSRIKVMAEMDIAERRVPQDGRISVTVDDKGIDLRVSTLPTQYGERVVMRVLDRRTATRTLNELGFSHHNLEIFDRLIHQPHGIILVTGPTGSGKTTTLYASLNALKSPTINIMTCEDPIEYELDRISQSNVNVRAGLTFATQLRAILRQDPDVVLVGEIRDAETAETAFRAALTGHLVLSTLHCNEAAGAPTRLLDMGVPPFLIASAIIGVVAQRLVRRLCPHCRREVPINENRATLLKEVTGRDYAGTSLFEPAPGGCNQCDHMGTRGRMGIHEIASIDDRMQSLIMRQAETSVLRQNAIQAGMIPMVLDGLEKAQQGLTTLEDVQRKVGWIIEGT